MWEILGFFRFVNIMPLFQLSNLKPAQNVYVANPLKHKIWADTWWEPFIMASAIKALDSPEESFKVLCTLYCDFITNMTSPLTNEVKHLRPDLPKRKGKGSTGLGVTVSAATWIFVVTLASWWSVFTTPDFTTWFGRQWGCIGMTPP